MNHRGGQYGKKRRGGSVGGNPGIVSNNSVWGNNDRREEQRGKRDGPRQGRSSSNVNKRGNGILYSHAATSDNKSNVTHTATGGGSRTSGEDTLSGASRFASACQHIQDSLNKYLETHPITELSDEEEGETLEAQDGLLARVLGGLSESGEELPLQHLRDALSSGALTCLICIHAIRRTDETWNCLQCHAVLHLSCIQKWGRDSVYQRTEQEREHNEKVDVTDIQWSCPKCRHQYPQPAIPREYHCYCGKMRDPPFDPWLLPHSCGEKCGRLLQPECGHTCLMLCHPGPCAPCPVTVSVTCQCGHSAPAPHRCSRKTWLCGQPCGRMLSCGQHRCSQPCHSGPCAACPRTSQQPCYCGAHTRTQPCSEPRWNCQQECGRPFPCGHHTCQKLCHPPGECGEQCPPSTTTRYCPCGKTKQTPDLPCHELVLVCGDTCDRVLSCGQHRCTDRCHTGPCSTCLQYSTRQCRCGARVRNVQCSKVFSCDTKCKRLRDCKKHPCNKKCCLGDCPPCEQLCGKTLHCGNHKCSSRCHTGPCYPCNRTTELRCPCGGTVCTVPCGRERVSKPPRCLLPCTHRAKCHHPQPPHRCHAGPCPPCEQSCQLSLPCPHRCPVPCHDAVEVAVRDDRKRAGPWEPAPETRLETRKMPCPPCKVPVSVVCRGLHGVQQQPCSAACHYSCGAPCGRRLACSRHTCEKPCHTPDGEDMEAAITKSEKRVPEAELLKRVVPLGAVAKSACRQCTRQCAQVPGAGCSHLCTLPCHPGSCPPCETQLTFRCYCSLIMLKRRCREWTAGNTSKSCGNPCYKLTSCSHPCQKLCHPPPCSSPSECPERVPARCSCGRRHQNLPCRDTFNEDGTRVQHAIKCDEACKERQRQREQARTEERLRQQEVQDAEQRRETEEFERRMAGRRSRGKRRVTEDQEERRGWRHYTRHVAAVATVTVMLVAVWWGYGA